MSGFENTAGLIPDVVDACVALAVGACSSLLVLFLLGLALRSYGERHAVDRRARAQARRRTERSSHAARAASTRPSA